MTSIDSPTENIFAAAAAPSGSCAPSPSSSSALFHMDEWNADVLLQVMAYVNVVDAGRWAQTARRYYYWIEQYRLLRGPELVAVASQASSSPGTSGSPASDPVRWSPRFACRGLPRGPPQLTPDQLCQAAVRQLQAPPHLALAFCTTFHQTAAMESLAPHLPAHTVVLGVTAEAIQSSLPHPTAGSVPECQSHTALMLASFMGTTTPRGRSEGEQGRRVHVEPFLFPFQNPPRPSGAQLARQLILRLRGLQQQFEERSTPTLVTPREPRPGDHEAMKNPGGENHQEGWKAFIIYASGRGGAEVEPLVHAVQQEFPEATLVGGICSDGFVSTPIPPLHLGAGEQEELAVWRATLERMSSMDLQHLYSCLGGKEQWQRKGCMKSDLVEAVYNWSLTRKYVVSSVPPEAGGIFGVALYGDVPVRSVVSRGVVSTTTGGVPRPVSPFYVQVSELHRPGDESYMFTGDDTPPYHLIRRIVNRETGKEYSARELYLAMGEPSMVGLRLPGDDGFNMHSPHPISLNLNAFLLFMGGVDSNLESLVGYNLDLFDLDGPTCVLDMEERMSMLRDQTQGEEILGAIMISCNGRGPQAGSLITEEMADAVRFARVFPLVPCLGFYAGGEIGPLALAGRRSVFQKGHAALQGFTAVFAIFIVPKVDLSSVYLNESPDHVAAFIKNRFRMTS